MTFDKNHKIPTTALWSGLALASPLWIFAILFIVPQSFLPPPVALAYMLAYGAILLSFLGGIRWGTALVAPEPSIVINRRLFEFCGSTIPAFIGWVAVFCPPKIGFSILISGFLISAFWDVISTTGGRLPAWFASFRIILTAIIVPALLVMLGGLIF